MNHNRQTQIHHQDCGQICAQPSALQSAAEAMARSWASDTPAVRSARALRLAPVVAWLRGGTSLDTATTATVPPKPSDQAIAPSLAGS